MEQTWEKTVMTQKFVVAFVVIFTLGALGWTGSAIAQSNYPNKPVRLIVPFSAGGGTDITARFLANELKQELGQNVIVENKPGGGSLVGTRYVILSAPDGYTLLVGSQSTNGTAPATHKDWEYTTKDLTAIAQTLINVNLLLVQPDFKAHSIAELLKLAKAQPGVLNYGSAGTGSFAHIASSTLWAKTGVNLVHVPYKGVRKAVTALLKGEVDVQMSPVSVAKPLIESGKVRILGHTGEGRLKIFPDVPSISETVPGYSVVLWGGIQGPAGMPKEVVDILINALKRTLAKKAFVDFVASQGGKIGTLTGQEFARFIEADAKKWKERLRVANIVSK